ncbi:MAG: metallophosphoesterase [Halobacteriales archaeon]
MIAVLSDTHRQDGHGLAGRAREAVQEAGVLLHAGDFTTPATFEALREVAGRIEAVWGNRDAAALRDRLPAKRTVEHEGVRITLVHGHEHDETALSLLGRAEEADVVVFGHSHRPVIVEAGEVVLLNPGSHADPRGNPASHAELASADGGVVARLLTSDGAEIDATRVA